MALYLNGSKVKVLSSNNSYNLLSPTTIIPPIYQQVEYISADKNVGAYLNLGFTFDTAATVYIEQFLDEAPTYASTDQSTYIFGAAENSGALRCMLTSPGNQHGVFIYGSSGTAYNYSVGKLLYEGKNRLKLVFKPLDLHWENLDTGELSVKEATNGTFSMTSNLYLLGQNYNGNPRFNITNGVSRKVGKFSYYNKNDELVCDLIPCYRKSDGEIGMYDLVTKNFLTNAGTGSFSKGNNKNEYCIIVSTSKRLLSSDNYILKDSNGLYLIPKEE